MGLLHVYVGVLLILAKDAQATGSNSPGFFCGYIVSDTTEIEKHNYVTEPMRTTDYLRFLERMSQALTSHWNAYTFIYNLPEKPEPPVEMGSPLCTTDKKQILGYYKNNGLTLCLVVKPHLQVVEKAQCCRENCCGHYTCQPSGFVQSRYLVYCDAIYTNEGGCLLGTDELSETRPVDIDVSDFDNDFASSFSISETTSTPTSGCPNNEWYFAFRHDFLPSSCLCMCG